MQWNQISILMFSQTLIKVTHPLFSSRNVQYKLYIALYKTIRKILKCIELKLTKVISHYKDTSFSKS